MYMFHANGSVLRDSISEKEMEEEGLQASDTNKWMK